MHIAQYCWYRSPGSKRSSPKLNCVKSHRQTLQDQKKSPQEFICGTHIMVVRDYIILIKQQSTESTGKKPVFQIRVLLSGSRSDFFSWVRTRIGQKIQTRSGKSGSGSMKKTPENCKYKFKQKNISYLALSTLSFLVRFIQNLSKEHHLDRFILFKKTLT